MNTKTLMPALLQKMDAYGRAANYLSVGQIYLYDNSLLKRPLELGDIKHMLLGHWGTTPGQSFVYVHLNRIVKKYDLDMIYVSGPGPRRSGGGQQYVPRGHVQRGLSQHQPRRGRASEALCPILVSRGIPSHASASNSRQPARMPFTTVAPVPLAATSPQESRKK